MASIPGLNFTSLKQQVSQALSVSTPVSVAASPVVALNVGPGSAGIGGNTAGGSAATATPTVTSSPSLPGDNVTLPGSPTISPSFAVPRLTGGSGLPASDSLDPQVFGAPSGNGLADLFKDPVILLALAGVALLFMRKA